MNLKQTFLLGGAAIALLSLTSCAKQNNLKRIEGDWELVSIDGEEPVGYTLLFDFEEDGDLIVFNSYYGYSQEGKWDWDGDLESDLSLTFDGDTYGYDVTLLTVDELEIESDGTKIVLEKD